MKTIRFFLILIAVFLTGTIWCFSKPEKPDVPKNPSGLITSPKGTTLPDITEPFLPSAKKPAGPLITLDDCLKTAFMKHPDILSKRTAVDVQEAKLQQIYALYIPTVSVTFTNSYQKPEPANPLPTTNQSQVNASYTLWDSKQRAEKVNAARENLMAAVLDLKSAWVDKADEVIEAYDGVILQEWLVIIQEDDLAKAIENLRVANGFYNAGAKSKIDVTQAEIGVEKSQVNLAKVKTDLRDARVRLAKSVGVDVSEITGKQLEDLLNEEKILPDRQEALAEMEKSHPALLTFTAQEKGALALAKAFENQVLPTCLCPGIVRNPGTVCP